MLVGQVPPPTHTHIPHIAYTALIGNRTRPHAWMGLACCHYTMCHVGNTMTSMPDWLAWQHVSECHQHRASGTHPKCNTQVWGIVFRPHAWRAYMMSLHHVCSRLWLLSRNLSRIVSAASLPDGRRWTLMTTFLSRTCEHSPRAAHDHIQPHCEPYE